MIANHKNAFFEYTISIVQKNQTIKYYKSNIVPIFIYRLYGIYINFYYIIV